MGRPKGSRNKSTSKSVDNPSACVDTVFHPEYVSLSRDCRISWKQFCISMYNANYGISHFIPNAKLTDKQRLELLTRYDNRYKKPTKQDEAWLDAQLDK